MSKVEHPVDEALYQLQEAERHYRRMCRRYRQEMKEMLVNVVDDRNIAYKLHDQDLRIDELEKQLATKLEECNDCGYV